MRFFIIVIFIFSVNLTYSQNSKLSEQQAKEAVNSIVKHCGLIQNFVVRENSDVKTAVAFIKNKKRYIEYNPEIIAAIVDSSNTDWSAVSILAHEIAHHLLGHTLDPASISPGDEMACDRFSGFILHSMGASKEESLAAMEIAGNPHGTKVHPPKSARLDAITMGWEDSENLKNKVQSNPIKSKNEFLFVVVFEGDENNYYIDQNQKLIWYNNYAQPIIFGSFEESENNNFVYRIYWEDQNFYVDSKNNIWNITEYEAQMKVGYLESYITEEEVLD